MPRGVPNTLDSIRARLIVVDLGFVTPCSVWPDCKTSDGYGTVSYKAKMHLVHRLLFPGELASDVELDHLCHSLSDDCVAGDACLHRSCANPEHLDPVSGHENWLRSQCITLQYARRSHCGSGHEYSEQNTVYHMEDGKPRRRCRLCLQARNPQIVIASRERRAARRAG